MADTSPPPPPPSHDPRNSSEWRFNTLTCPTEWIESYHPGGLHPVHLGDTLNEGRYRILRKLGYGAFSTVWLARDTKVGRYVAIKISRADTTALGKELKIYQDLADYAQKFQTKTQSTIDTNSSPIVQLLGHFIHEGPNGSHLCLLFEPMGATANTMLEQIRGPGYYKSPIPLWLAKSLAKQLLLGLDFLHSCGIAHGDVQPGNLLFAATDLNDLDEKILTQAEDELSISKPIQRKDGKADKWAPRYLCSTKSLAEYVALDENVVIKLSDLGAAFPFSQPPERCETPMALRAPELVLGTAFDHRVDIWSFGCLLYEFLTGTPLFTVSSWDGTPQHENDDDHLLQMMDILGKLPSHLADKWARRARYIGLGGEVIRTDVSEEEDPESSELVFGPSLETLLEDLPDEIRDEERRVILGLLKRCLAYDKEQRPTATELLQEPWFQDNKT